MTSCCVGQGLGLAASHSGHQRVGGTQIDAGGQSVLMGGLRLSRFRYL
jgi:hypothetical protein